eukprot:905252-Pleurochrysis_carterae.AAC.1
MLRAVLPETSRSTHDQSVQLLQCVIAKLNKIDLRLDDLQTCMCSVERTVHHRSNDVEAQLSRLHSAIDSTREQLNTAAEMRARNDHTRNTIQRRVIVIALLMLALAMVKKSFRNVIWARIQHLPASSLLRYTAVGTISLLIDLIVTLDDEKRALRADFLLKPFRCLTFRQAANEMGSPSLLAVLATLFAKRFA